MMDEIPVMRPFSREPIERRRVGVIIRDMFEMLRHDPGDWSKLERAEEVTDEFERVMREIWELDPDKEFIFGEFVQGDVFMELDKEFIEVMGG